MAGVGPRYLGEHDVRPRGSTPREPIVLCARVARAARLGVGPGPAHLLELGAGGQGELVAEPEVGDVSALPVVAQGAALETNEAGDGDEAGIRRAARAPVDLRAALVGVPARERVAVLGRCGPCGGVGGALVV